LTRGAVVSVDPVTATLPVLPGSDQSGATLSSGAAVGHVLAADAVSVAEHAASIRTNDAVQATSATTVDTREEFTDVTLQAHCLLPSPAGIQAFTEQRHLHGAVPSDFPTSTSSISNARNEHVGWGRSNPPPSRHSCGGWTTHAWSRTRRPIASTRCSPVLDICSSISTGSVTSHRRCKPLNAFWFVVRHKNCTTGRQDAQRK